MRHVQPDFDDKHSIEMHVYVTSVPKEQDRVSTGVIGAVFVVAVGSLCYATREL